LISTFIPIYSIITSQITITSIRTENSTPMRLTQIIDVAAIL
jgi:hypothetical protein